MTFNSERVSRSAVIQINGSVENVFPLFGPIREKEWAAGWEPEVIFGSPESVEEHMIFQTKGQPGEGKYTWAITQYQPAQHLIEYTVTTGGRIWFIRVECEPSGDKTNAVVSYTYTGLSQQGNELNKTALQKMFSKDLKDWEEALNYYLDTGRRLENS